MVTSCQRWRCFKADVADASLQGVDLHDVGVTIVGVPNADMRRRLARLMNFRPDEDLRMLKSGFGDVRAPKLWYDQACATLTELGFVTHPLDPWLFLSCRGYPEEYMGDIFANMSADTSTDLFCTPVWFCQS